MISEFITPVEFVLITQVDKSIKGNWEFYSAEDVHYYSLNSIQFLFRCSYFNRSLPATSRDGRFLIAFTTSCIVNGSVDGSNWGRGGSISFGHGVS